MVARSADGNPYYLEELIKVLIDDGVIVKGEHRWQVAGERLAEVRLPPTLTGILQARFDSLSLSESQVLQRAAIIGRIFWDKAVAALSLTSLVDASVDETLVMLRRLQEREMIFERRETAFVGSREYIFKHVLMRDAVYESVLKRERLAYHALAADWLIAHGGEHSSQVAGMIAEHLERAGQNDQAAEYLCRAGREALRVSAFQEGLAFLERSLALLPAGDPAKVTALLLAGEALLRLSDYGGAQDYLQRSLALARQAGDRRSCAAALIYLGDIAAERGSFDETRLDLEEALSLARAIQNQSLIAQASLNLGWVEYKVGFYDRARSYLAQSRDIYQALEDRRGLAYALNRLGVADVVLGDFASAENCFTNSLEILRPAGDRWEMSKVFNNLGYLAQSTGNYTAARSYYHTARQLNQEIGNRPGVVTSLSNLGHAACDLGDYSTACQTFHQALELAMSIGALPLVLDGLNGFARLLADTGQEQRAIEILGLVLAHPALQFETRRLIDPVLAGLMARLSPAVVHASLERGQHLPLEEVVRQMLAWPGAG